MEIPVISFLIGATAHWGLYKQIMLKYCVLPPWKRWKSPVLFRGEAQMWQCGQTPRLSQPGCDPQCPLCHQDLAPHTELQPPAGALARAPLPVLAVSFSPEFLQQTAGSWVHVKLLNSNPNLLNTVMPLSWRQLAGIQCNVFETSFLSQWFWTFGEKPPEQQVWDSSWSSCSPTGWLAGLLMLPCPKAAAREDEDGSPSSMGTHSPGSAVPAPAQPRWGWALSMPR